MSLVSIVIVNWNGEEVLPDCLESLLRLNHKDFEIIIVDNASIDNSIDIVNKICGSKAKIVRLERNAGFAAGVNAGVGNASGIIIALLNNDMAVEQSWLDQPLELLKDETVGIVSCRQMNYYDRTKIDELYHCVLKSLVLMPFVRGAEYRGDDERLSRPGYVISANGGSMIVRAEVFRALGGLDPAFFGYMEETDFCLRAFLRGWRCIYAPSAVVYHKDGFSFKKNRGRQFYLSERNRVWLLYKNIPISDILKSLHYVLGRELIRFRDSCLVYKNPFLYFKARWDAIWGLGRYKNIRKENVALFRNRRKEFYRLKELRKLDLTDKG